ncbi:Txe/YoeB family addiction module toxin [Synechocystis sp. B12]|jgi:toxin YoeB|uniref:Txe/YoeB family addiction module toxin n=1 Tax=unclassified Synechocystis TaxID=2640012 RepID=UPI001BB0A23B|nr:MULTISPECIES: Txe/YoeB family addiction module toxin [unclassified Synechocystis]QUS59324.1 Txe/YoeB family addiction module toxin [Synechocystis sp. PCC 7338]UAJ71510.1 Txe/YoeB family addiction module toxin [Synechocystis sp. PCC 7339]WLT39525.1 Txe/YoeB family addiction module toxin [Synechocystis sp. B12]
MKEVVLDPQAIEDIKWWIQQDKKLALKIMELIETLPKSPFAGKGKPEKLRFNLSGFWSRRITQEHRLVYEVTDDFIRVVSCRYHYR